MREETPDPAKSDPEPNKGTGAQSGPDTDPATDRVPGRKRRRRFGIWKLLSILFLSALLFMVGLSLSGRMLSAPVWLTTQLESRANASLGTGRISLGRVQFQVDEKGIPRIILGNLGIFDAGGVEVARLNDVGVSLSFQSLLRGQLKPRSIDLSGAQMTFLRRADGEFNVSFGAGEAASGNLPGVLDAIDDLMVTSALDQVEQLKARDLTITLEDVRSGRRWQVIEGELQLRRAEGGLDISMALEIFNGTEDLAELVMGIRTFGDSSKAMLGVSFANAAARDIAAQSPVLSFLGVLQAPISGALRTEFDEAGGLVSVAGTLEISKGALQPTPDVDPVAFESAKAYFSFDPNARKLEFSQVSVESQALSLVAQGQAYLRDYDKGWPSTMLGQFKLSSLDAHPEHVFSDAVSFSGGETDFRLRLNPFSVEIGQLVLRQQDEKLVANGEISAQPEGWNVRTDFTLDQITHERLLRLWPVAMIPNTRNWLVENVQSGVLSDVHGALRIRPGQKARMSVGWRFRDTTVRYIQSQPAITKASGFASIDRATFSLSVDEGFIRAPLGGVINMAGSNLQIPDIATFPARLNINLVGDATTTAALSLLDARPFRILKNTEFAPDVAQGRVKFRANIGFDLKRNIDMDDVQYWVSGEISDLISQKLVPGRTVRAARLNLLADNDFVEISGPARIGVVAADVVWRQELGTDQVSHSSVTGNIELSEAFLDEFNIALPANSLRGKGTGQFSLNLVRGEDTEFELSSDLNRLGLRIPQIGWSKPRNATGKLFVHGTLGESPRVDALEIRASGLSAIDGKVALNSDGTLATASFGRVRVGGWIDAPVIFKGRGAGATPAIIIPSGTIDVRKTSFGGASGGSASGGSGGAGGPITLNADRVIVSEGISLTGFAGDFNSAGGMSGRFTARMNGNTPLSGRLEPDKNGTAVRIQSSNAGGVIRDSGIVEYANKGELDLTLRPQKANGVYLGQMTITNTKVLNAPGLTDLLSAISIVGLLDQLSGEGISFDRVEASFTLTPKFVRLTQSSAIGPSLGVSLDGVYDLTRSTMEMQGVVSPVYFLNGIGAIFSRPGEGFFGFYYRLTGTSAAPKVSVNPLSILAPGVFRDLFRAPPPKVGE